MKKIATSSFLLLCIVFLAGCGQQSVTQTQPINQQVANQQDPISIDQKYNQGSWKKIISETCKKFNDGCNECTRINKDSAGCTKIGCSEYKKPYCLDDKEWVEISVFTQAHPEPWNEDNNIKPFLSQKGVEVYDIRIAIRGVCEALSCPSGKLKEVLINQQDKEKINKILKDYKINLGIK